jgi:tetratricopeptide (TPR) repeat protein
VKVQIGDRSSIQLEWFHFFESCESLIRAGQSQQVIPMLLGQKIKDIPRAQAERFAHFHYRVGLFSRGLQILSPIVHPSETGGVLASDRELTTYAVLLIKIGSLQEAKNILSKVSSQIYDVELYRAFAAQAEWAYNKAIPHLRKYLAHSNLTPYEVAIAEVNLAASLIAEGESEESRVLLGRLFEKARTNQWTLIYKNAQELLGQLSLVVGDFNEAQRLLNEAAAKERYRDSGIFDFFIDKWRAIVEIRQNPKNMSSQEGLHEIRRKAIEFKHWESVRECDRVLALALQSQTLLDQVYFGTPFPAYRQRLVRDAACWSKPSATYVWGAENASIFDLATAQSDDNAIRLKAGQALHRALTALAGDRYRPLFIGQLFSKAYPGECFIAEFSEGRIAAVISRLRNWSKKHHLPLVFDVREQFFRLTFDETAASAGLRFTSDVFSDSYENPMASGFLRLQAKMGSTLFSSNEVAEVLAISKSTAVRLLGWGVKEGKIKTIGNNKSKKYGFAA